MKLRKIKVSENLVPMVSTSEEAIVFYQQTVDALIDRQARITRALMVIQRTGVVSSSEFNELVDGLRNEMFDD